MYSWMRPWVSPKEPSCSVAKQALPITAFEHHAPGHRHFDALRFEFLVGQLAVAVVQVGGVVAWA
jgi:hypothetical protein